jgi:hypothetical protein
LMYFGFFSFPSLGSLLAGGSSAIHHGVHYAHNKGEGTVWLMCCKSCD